MTPEEALEFVRTNHRAVLATFKKDGGVQTSPVTVGVDGSDIVISSRETAYKVKNLKRDPRYTLCVFTDNFFGPWVQTEGRVEIVSLPEAMDGLVDYYRNISGEHPDWDDYKRVMNEDRRVLVRLKIEKAGPNKSG